jgi:hypothetical protein
MNIPQINPSAGEIVESVIVKGDLAKLSPQERASYYESVCRSVGLNPFTQPFGYIQLGGKLVLYAKKDATDQLRRIHGVSIEVISQGLTNDIYNVHVRATTKEGRTDEDFGVVSLPEAIKGEIRANLVMKGITKAKRRVTLSICGLGWLDESEIEDIPVNDKREIAVDPATGEIEQSFAEPAQPEISETTLSLEEMAREAAMRGRDTLAKFFKQRTPAEQKRLREIERELISLYPK